MVTTGLFLLAISLDHVTGLEVFFGLMLPQGVVFLIWAFALNVLRERAGTLDFLALQGVGRILPTTTVALILAQFSAAGFPLLAGFSMRVLLLDQLAASNVFGAFGMMLGSFGLLVAALRTLAVFVMVPETEPRNLPPETPGLRIWLVGGILLLLLFGLLPQWLAPLVTRLPLAFPAWGT
jgi:formate hydrogenlyase subunit 3/multisubunit Na+/H+ antiporter MnhD subunit